MRIKHYGISLRDQIHTSLLIFASLQVCFKIEAMINVSDLSKLIFYAVFWIFLMTFQYYKEYLNWKKENPKEFQKEKKEGKQILLWKR